MPPNRAARPLLVPLALAAILALALWPYLGGLTYWPMTQDAPVWLSRAAIGNPDWPEFVFRTRHFNVGWRPVTALTFTLDSTLGGLRPFVYRVTDVLLLGLAGLTAFFTLRRLAPRLPVGAALLGCALFLMHRATEEVVPFFARRSYLLAVLFSMAALGVLARGLQAESDGAAALKPGRSLAVALLLALAVLSNEAAVIAVGVAALLGLRSLVGRPGALTGLARTLGPTALVLAVLFWIRSTVVGELVGGYEPTAERGLLASRILPLFAARLAVSDLVPGIDPVRGSIAGRVLFLGAGLYFAVRVLGSLRKWRSSPRPVFAAWLVACPVLFAVLGVYFDRVLYVALAPYAFLLAEVLSDSLARWRDRPLVLGLHLVPQAVLLLPLLATSPSLRGPSPERMHEWDRKNELMQRLMDSLEGCEEPARISLVLPWWKERTAFRGAGEDRKLHRAVRLAVSWTQDWFAGRDFVIRDVVYLDRSDEAGPHGRPTLLREADGPWLLLPPGQTCIVREGREFVVRGPGDERRVPLFGQGNQPRVHYLFDFTAEGDGLTLLDRP